MTTSPPDISSLTLSPQRLQRQEASYDPQQQQQRFPDQHYHFDTSPAGIPGYQPTKRAGLPSQWMGNTSTGTPPQGQLSDSRSLSPLQASDISSSGGSPPVPHPLQPQVPPIAGAVSPEDEIIPTAIVIKNIPFNVKRETLLDIIASLNIPTPYAFNYHLDQAGSFRGLAFANFRQAVDADAVVAALNGFDVQGRKLRVEYKKVLQAGEKERIEREKALRRMRSMQLEKESQAANTVYDDFGVNQSAGAMMPTSRTYSGVPTQPMLHSQPVPQPYIPNQQQQQPQQPLYPQQAQQQQVPPTPAASSTKSSTTTELDLNDPSTLEIYSRILLFKDDHMRDELAFSRTLTPKQRRVVHLVAQKLGVYHYSIGEGEERYAVVTRTPPGSGGNDQPPPPPQPNLRPIRQMSQQQLSRAYLSPSGNPFSVQSTLQDNSYAAAAGTSAASLRAKKSMPDMKSLHQAPRLSTRSSNGNIREGYATISSPMRRSPGFGLFNQNGSTEGSGIPPVPMLSIPGVPVEGPPSAGGGSNSGVVRQPRGPGAGGFGRNRSNVSPSDSRSPGGLDTRSHEPLDI